MIIIKGNTVYEKASEYIDNLKLEDKVIITNIKHLFRRENLRMKSLPPFIIKIYK